VIRDYPSVLGADSNTFRLSPCRKQGIKIMKLFVRTFAIALAITSTALAQQNSDPYAEALRYKFDQPRTAILAIEAEIRAAKPDQLPAIEAKLLKILQASEATTDAKEWACRQLRQVGSDRSAPALAALVADKDLATVARWALQSIPGPQVDALLREALGKTDATMKAGVVQTIGARGDRQAVALVAPLASDKNVEIADAALYALGHIGGDEALKALQAAKPPQKLNRYLFHAVLLCAERLAAEGKSADAADVYGHLYKQSDDAIIKTAALRGIILCQKAKAAPVVLAAMKTGCPKVRVSAARFACELGGSEVLSPIIAELSTLPVDARLSLLAMINDKSALPAVLAAVKSDDPAMRAAALGALGRLGDAAHVPVLLAIAAEAKDEPQAAARQALQELSCAEVDAVLIKAAGEGSPAAQAEAIRALAARGAAAAMPTLLQAARSADSPLVADVFAALGELADAKTLPALLKLLVDAKAPRQRTAAEQAIIAASRRLDKDASAAAIEAAMAGASGEVRCSLLRVLARTQSAKALAALRTAAGDADAQVKDAAIRGLAEWPDAAALADLVRIARSADSQVHKILALRGILRLATLKRGGPPAAQAAKFLGEAMPLATRAQEKKLILAALAEVKHPAALEIALRSVGDPEVEAEAVMTVCKLARNTSVGHPDAARAAVQKVLDVCRSPAARQVAESALLVVDKTNIAPQGTATSPDNLEKDGNAGGDQAAIDGNTDTYWDEQDGQKLYRLVVTFKQPQKVAAIGIQGYDHHDFAPKDFEILCDGKLIKKVDNAQYDNNTLLIGFDETTCTTVELKITGSYGGSPAIRELGIYQSASRR